MSSSGRRMFKGKLRKNNSRKNGRGLKAKRSHHENVTYPLDGSVQNLIYSARQRGYRFANGEGHGVLKISYDIPNRRGHRKKRVPIGRVDKKIGLVEIYTGFVGRGQFREHERAILQLEKMARGAFEWEQREYYGRHQRP